VPAGGSAAVRRKRRQRDRRRRDPRTALAQPASAGYPVLAQTARSAGGVPPEEEFAQGLAIVLRGFRAMLAEPSP
jgi:Tetracyclin repressor-like, C-terminal domain